MTRAELKALSNEEINRLIATEVLGWIIWDNDGKILPHIWKSLERFEQDYDCDMMLSQWNPATDDNDMRLVRAEIERQGLAPAFDKTLPLAMGSSPHSSELSLFHYVNATPREQAEAALNAVQKEKT